MRRAAVGQRSDRHPVAGRGIAVLQSQVATHRQTIRPIQRRAVHDIVTVGHSQRSADGLGDIGINQDRRIAATVAVGDLDKSTHVGVVNGDRVTGGTGRLIDDQVARDTAVGVDTQGDDLVSSTAIRERHVAVGCQAIQADRLADCTRSGTRVDGQVEHRQSVGRRCTAQRHIVDPDTTDDRQVARHPQARRNNGHGGRIDRRDGIIV